MVDPSLVEAVVRRLERERPHWLTAVPHASAVAAEAFVRHGHLPKPLLVQRMYLEVATAVRDARRLKRAETPRPLVVDPEAREAPPSLSRAVLEETLVRRGAAHRDAPALAAWLAGETAASIAARLGRNRKGLLTALRRGRLALGLTAEEARALIGLARGERQADLAWGSWRPSRGAASTAGTRAHRTRKGSRPVDPSTVCLRQQRALAKLRGCA